MVMPLEQFELKVPKRKWFFSVNGVDNFVFSLGLGIVRTRIVRTGIGARSS